jgi:hypothetical protein
VGHVLHAGRLYRKFCAEPDRSRGQRLFHWAEWIPVFSSALAVGFLAVLLSSKVTTAFLRYCGAVLLLQTLVGVLGFLLYGWADLRGPSGTIFQNVVSAAPPFAPLLLPNLAILGFIGIVAMRRELPA